MPKHLTKAHSYGPSCNPTHTGLIAQVVGIEQGESLLSLLSICKTYKYSRVPVYNQESTPSSGPYVALGHSIAYISESALLHLSLSLSCIYAAVSQTIDHITGVALTRELIEYLDKPNESLATIPASSIMEVGATKDCG